MPAKASEARPQTVVKEELPATYCNTLTNQLTNQLNTKVRIVQQGPRGKLEIEYYSSDDLDRLVGLLSQ